MNRTDYIQQAFDALIKNISASSQAAGQVVSGKTIASLNTRNISDYGGQLWGASYLGVLDAGRRPGKFPPLAPIRDWVLARGIDRAWQMSSHSAAYIIARKIAREGSALFRRGGRTDVLQDNFAIFEKQIMEGLYMDFVQTVNKTFKKS